MRRRGIGATTRIDKHNMRLSKTCLKNQARQINGKYAIGVGIEHDITIPPVGKLTKGWLEPTSDGEFALIIEETFDIITEMDLLGNKVIMQRSSSDNRPFAASQIKCPREIEISYDLVNFENEDDRISFLEEIRTVSVFSEGILQRKSELPDPEIIVNLTKTIIAAVLAKPFVDKVAEKVGDKLSEEVANEIVDFYKLFKQIIISSGKYLIPKNRPKTYVLQAAGEPKLEFVIRTTDADKAINAIKTQNLQEPFRVAAEMKRNIKATNVQFILTENNEWKFNYLLTADGKVIGTPESYSKQAQMIDMMNQQICELQKQSGSGTDS